MHKKTYFDSKTWKCQKNNIPLLAKLETMAKKTTKPTERNPLLIPVRELAHAAHQIFMLKPNETIILNKLKEIYSSGVDTGYQRRISDQKVFNGKRKARIKKSTDDLLTHIEDTIYGGTTTKTEEV